MCEHHDHSRRQALKLMGSLGAAAGLAGLGLPVMAAESSNIGAFMPGKGWMAASGATCEGDGTPLQFIPRTKPDANPLQDELKKYPKCPYCGMDRAMYHHSRHLVQYEDDLVDGTCSIHCLAISLSLNMDRGPKAIWAADYGAADETKPLTLADKASYLIGSKLKGTMTANSKVAFADKGQAEAAKAKEGGTLASFDEALKQTYVDMAADTVRIRKARAERRQKPGSQG